MYSSINLCHYVGCRFPNKWLSIFPSPSIEALFSDPAEPTLNMGGYHEASWEPHRTNRLKNFLWVSPGTGMYSSVLRHQNSRSPGLVVDLSFLESSGLWPLPFRGRLSQATSVPESPPWRCLLWKLTVSHVGQSLNMQPWRTEFRCQRMLLSSSGAMQRLVLRGELYRVPSMEV